MKFRKHASLSFGIACISLIALNRVAFAACYNSEAGEYCLTYEKYKCPKGCYCEKVTGDWGALDRKGNGQKEIYNKDVIAWCSSRDYKKCAWHKTEGECGSSNEAGVHLCPSDFPLSDEGMSAEHQCYAKYNNSRLYNIEIECNNGTYLPKGTGVMSLDSRGIRTLNNTSDAYCKKCESGFSCPGGKFKPSLSSDQGRSEQKKSVHCDPGRYIPTGWSSCAPCEYSDRYYCPGGTFVPSTTKNMGLKECPNGQFSNANQTGCMGTTIHCNAGQYLPSKAKKCRDCQRYYLCEGGTFSIGVASDQGIRKCDGNLVANANHTACEVDNSGKQLIELIKTGDITVPAGKYLPADKTKPVTCTWTTKYCPGGTFAKASVDQGVEDCPANSKANKDRTACTITLNKVQMQYGPSGTGTPYTRQCWHQTDQNSDYAACVLGIRKKD